MEQQALLRAGFSRTRLVIAASSLLAASLIASSTALAADVTVVDGLLQFPNVRVVNAAEPAVSATPAQGGLKAYKDSATGELRGPTLEERQAEAQAVSSAATSSARRSSSASDTVAGRNVPAASGVGVMLDESSLQYTVMVRKADGSLEEICVTGPDAAREVLQRSAAAVSSKKELSNVR